MTSRTSRRPPVSKRPLFRAIVLHDDHLTARRGSTVAQSITAEMGLGDRCEIGLWNVALLDTLFGRVAALEASSADIVIVALRSSTGFSMDLKTWLARWLAQKKNDSAALIVVFENNGAPAAQNARAFVERAAQNIGRDFFSQPVDGTLNEPEVNEFLWVL